VPRERLLAARSVLEQFLEQVGLRSDWTLSRRKESAKVFAWHAFREANFSGEAPATLRGVAPG